MTHRPPVATCCASVIHTRGELPYAAIINHACWGIFRQERDAVLFVGEALGVPRREMLAQLREMEVGER